MPLKILLLQARKPEDTAKDEERQSFADRAGLDVTQFIPYDLLTGVPSLKEVRRYDALMVGGSGDYYVSKGNLPHFEATLQLLQDVTAVGYPTFASCFGFQLLVQALGGEIIFDPENMEVGTFDLTLTEAGQQDEVLGILPPVFAAQLGRKDRAVRLPEGAVNLAYSQRIPYQALRIPGKPVWGTQFHPELSLEDNRKRFVRYQAGYGSVMSEAELQKTLERFGPSPETEKLLARFWKLFLDD